MQQLLLFDKKTMTKKEYIKTLMNLYNKMVSENEKQLKKYDKEKVNFARQQPWKYFWGMQDTIYSDTMLHNLISMINKIENNLN